jgi:hypothetical protein
MTLFLEGPGSKMTVASIAKTLPLSCVLIGFVFVSGIPPFHLPLSLISSFLPCPRSSTQGLAWMLCRSTPSARPMPTRGQGEPAGRAQVSVSGRSPVLACFLGQLWDC